MNVYICIDLAELEEIPESLASDITNWLSEAELKAEFAESLAGQGPGIVLSVKKAMALKAPIKFFYGLARSHKCDCAVGYIDDQEQAQTVCYFGHNEGQLDVFEVANYLGL